MSNENVALVRRMYEAFGRRDAPAVLATLAPEVEFRQSTEVPWGGQYRGPQEVAAYFQKLTTTIESQVTLERFIDSGDVVVAVGHTRGKVLATGKSFDVPIAHAWTIRNGKVTRFEAYIDHPSMLPALR